MRRNLKSKFTFNLAGRKNFKIKKHQKNHKLGFKLGWLFLLVLFLLIAVSQLIQGIFNSRWKDKDQLSFIIANDEKVSFVKINKALGEAQIYNFEDNIMIEIIGGYGEYRIDKIKELADQEKKDLGMMLRDSMTFYFGVMIDGYVVGEGQDEINLKPMILTTILGKNKTNLSNWDLLYSYFYINKLRLENISYLQVAKLGFYEEETQADGKKVLILDKNKFDDYVLAHMAVSSFLEEKISWEIFNATEYAGLASTFGRIVGNSGLDLVGIRQTKNSYDKSFISVRDESVNNKSLNIFAKYFDLEVKKASEPGLEGETFNDRADVVVVLGNDFVGKYF